MIDHDGMSTENHGDVDATIAANLALIAADENLQGFGCLFQEEDADVCGDDGDDNGGCETPTVSSSGEQIFDPNECQSYTIWFDGDGLGFRMLQALSAFGATGEDITGLVLWGASVTLAKYITEHPHLVESKTVLELGCGSALPSMLSSRLHASKVVASDFREAALDQVDHHARENGCEIERLQLDWEDLPGTAQFQADTILASDVIYGVGLVPALTRAIRKYLKADGIVLMATRDGRRGIPEFRHIMKQTADNVCFDEIEILAFDDAYLPSIPSELEGDANSLARLKGEHSIYVYRRKQQQCPQQQERQHGLSTTDIMAGPKPVVPVSRSDTRDANRISPCHEVYPGLWVGSLSSLNELKSLHQVQQWKVISILDSEFLIGLCVSMILAIRNDDSSSAKVEQHEIWKMADKPRAHFLSERLTHVLKLIDDVIGGTNVTRQPSSACLVHCAKGVSRSVAVCAAWLITRQALTLQQAMERIREVRPNAQPNLGFLAGLRALESGKFQVL